MLGEVFSIKLSIFESAVGKDDHFRHAGNPDFHCLFVFHFRSRAAEMEPVHSSVIFVPIVNHTIVTSFEEPSESKEPYKDIKVCKLEKTDPLPRMWDRFPHTDFI